MSESAEHASLPSVEKKVHPMTAHRRTASILAAAGIVLGTAAYAFTQQRAAAHAQAPAAIELVPPHAVAAPAITGADISHVLDEIGSLRKEQAEGFRTLEGRVSKIEGYMQGENDARRERESRR